MMDSVLVKFVIDKDCLPDSCSLITLNAVNNQISRCNASKTPNACPLMVAASIFKRSEALGPNF